MIEVLRAIKVLKAFKAHRVREDLLGQRVIRVIRVILV